MNRTYKLDIDENTTIVFKDRKVIDFPVFIEKYDKIQKDDDYDIDCDDDYDIILWCTQIISLLEKHNVDIYNLQNYEISVFESFVELNWFDGTGFHYDNMKIKFDGIKYDVTGFCNYICNPKGCDYLYEIDGCGYLMIIKGMTDFSTTTPIVVIHEKPNDDYNSLNI